MTEVVPYGGVGQIGGNKLLVRDQDTRVFLDFGMTFGIRGKYFEEFLKPRVSAGMNDLVKMGLLPDPRLDDFQGAYRSDYAALMGLPAVAEPSLAGVLLSHIHMDHSSYIAFLHESVPVYASAASMAIAEAVSITGQRDFESEIWSWKERSGKAGSSREPPRTREWREVKPGSRFRAGGLDVVAYAVDHSVPGALMYLVHSSEGSLLYSGDLRVKGYGTQTVSSIESFGQESPDLMLCEGTRIKEQEMRTEDYIRSESTRVASEAKGLVVAGFAWRDLRRMMTFLEVAEASGRTLVLTMRDACALEALRSRGLDYPDPARHPSVEVLVEPKKSGRFDDSDYGVWERKYLGWANAVRSPDLPKDGAMRIVHAGFFDMTTMLDFDVPLGSAYIHSLSEAHTEDQEIDDKRLNNWLEFLRISRHDFHASGHASYPELQHLLGAVRPGRLVPIHTEHPRAFKKLHPKVKYPREGHPIVI